MSERFVGRFLYSPSIEKSNKKRKIPRGKKLGFGLRISLKLCDFTRRQNPFYKPIAKAGPCVSNPRKLD